MKTEIRFFGKNCVLTCDGDCDHAWGTNWYDVKEKTAPVDPGTYEGGCAKPTDKKHNKWCARECERSNLEDA